MKSYNLPLSFKLKPWIVKEILGQVPNKTAFVEEAVIKLWHERSLAQDSSVGQKRDKIKKNAPAGI